MKKLFGLAFLVATAASPLFAQVPLSAVSTGDHASLNGWIPSPQDAWHTDISDVSKYPVDTNNAYEQTAGEYLDGAHLHLDASLPYTIIDSSGGGYTFSHINPSDTDDSDATLYPVYDGMPIEGFPSSCWSNTADQSDHHALIFDRATGISYETYQIDHCNGTWYSYGNVVWNLTMPQGEKRSPGTSSVDAAGLSIFEGLLKYAEVQYAITNGLPDVGHALRFTLPHTKCGYYGNGAYGASLYMPPATHGACTLSNGAIMGMRIRLQAGFDTSSYSPTMKVVLNTLKKYGAILADNGSFMFFTADDNAGWSYPDLLAFNGITSKSFDVLSLNPIYTSDTAPKGALPTDALYSSATLVAPGTPVTLTPATTNASYSFIDNYGVLLNSNPVVVTPKVTTTYTMTSRNAYGTTTSSQVTVTVQDGATTGGGTVSPPVTNPPAASDPGTTATGNSTVVTFGQSVTMTATVTGRNPNGTVFFYSDGVQIGQVALNLGAATQGSGSVVATLSTTSLSVGSHSLTASYSGDSSNEAATSSADGITVNPLAKAATTITLSIAAH